MIIRISRPIYLVVTLACVFIVVLSGCAKGTKLIKEPEPYEIAKPLASASDKRLVATLDWVIVRAGPGTWAKNADWDEFLLRFENLSGSPIQITNVLVYDSLGTQIDARPDRKKLVKGSKETKRRYADSDIKIMAGWGGAELALAGAGVIVVGGALFASTLAYSAGPASAGAIAGAGAGVAAAAIAAPILIFHGLSRSSKNKKVNKEIIRRQTVLPIEIPSSQELSTDSFFPLVPSPTHLEVIYTDTENEYRLIIDTQEALNGLHLRPEKEDETKSIVKSGVLNEAKSPNASHLIVTTRTPRPVTPIIIQQIDGKVVSQAQSSLTTALESHKVEPGVHQIVIAPKANPEKSQVVTIDVKPGVNYYLGWHDSEPAIWKEEKTR